MQMSNPRDRFKCGATGDYVRNQLYEREPEIHIQPQSVIKLIEWARAYTEQKSMPDKDRKHVSNDIKHVEAQDDLAA